MTNPAAASTAAEPAAVGGEDGGGEALSEAQAAVYDRQLRVWGLEVQNRLSAAKILVAGGDGVAAEVAKNLVLAGAGLVALADRTPAASASPCNFLVPCGAEGTAAAAAAATLQQMNPLVVVKEQACGAGGSGVVGSGVGEAEVAGYGLVVASCSSFAEMAALDELCSRAGKQLFCIMTRGPSALTFVNLGLEHEFRAPAATAGGGGGGGAGGAKGGTLRYAPLGEALSTPLGALTRRTHPLYAVARAAHAYEAAQGRPPGADDGAALSAAAAKLAAAEAPDAAKAWHVPREDMLASWAASAGSELAPVAAVVGGVVANHVIRAVSGVSAPIHNLFLYTLFVDGMAGVAGAEETMPYAAA